MDGIVRDTTGFDADLSGQVLALAAGAAIVLAGLLGLAITSEILRRAGLAPRLQRPLDRIVPLSARRIAATVLTFSVTLLGPGAAQADDAPIRDWLSDGTTTTTTTTTSTTTPYPVATEERLIERASPRVPVAPSADVSHLAAQYVVVTGDCLWSIAAARLAPDATNGAIDEAWRAIYAVNTAAIGDNPNLIFPGLELELPPLAETPVTTP